jgi:hypothetical protein
MTPGALLMTVCDASLTDDYRGLIYGSNIFLIEATDVSQCLYQISYYLAISLRQPSYLTSKIGRITASLQKSVLVS